MKLFELAPSKGSRTEGKRKGRGPGTGNGKTAGRGHKGQKSRSGGGIRVGFEGGQMPIYRRLPKRGFTNIFAKEYVVINVSDLNKFESGTTITPRLLKEVGVVSKICDGIKVLGRGEIEVRDLTVQASKFSQTALDKITAAGGKSEVI